MAELTIDERLYDFAMTEGRGMSEMLLFECGYWIGILGDYLDEGFADDERFQLEHSSDWFHAGQFADAIEEGASYRDEHTAEDLYVWAHDWMAGRVSPDSPI